MQWVAAVFHYLWVYTLQPETIQQVLRFGQDWLQIVCLTNTRELSRRVPQSLLMMGQADFGESDVQNLAVMIMICLFSPGRTTNTKKSNPRTFAILP